MEIITDKSQEGAQFCKGFGGIGGDAMGCCLYSQQLYSSRFLGVSHLSLMVILWVTFLFKDQESLMSICLKIEYDSFLSDVLSVAVLKPSVSPV